MRRFLSGTILTLVVFLLPKTISAFTQTLSADGKAVRWNGSPRIPFAGNPTNRSGLSDSQVFSAVTRSLQRWQSASGGKASFDYWQGRGSDFETNSNYNSLSNVYFLSAGGQSPDPNVIGQTQVWYNTSTGEILETDVALNDINFRFTTNPQDSTRGGSSNVYIENVLTHEFGHAFGLAHSGTLQSTMLFLESQEQAHLSCDDITAIRGSYPGGKRAGGRISGRVFGEDGSPIHGAQVQAVSARRGVVLASALTDSGGSYAFPALEPGEYHLFAEPFYAGGSSLPAYYRNINHHICSGANFSRTFLTNGVGSPDLASVSVSDGGIIYAPQITARCSGGGGAYVPITTGSSQSWSAPTIASGNGFAFVDRFAGTFSSQALYYRVTAMNGRLDVRALAFSLYSPVQVALEIYDHSGSLVASRSSPIFQSTDSGYVNYDQALSVSNLDPGGEYIIKLIPSGLSLFAYPAGNYSVDAVPFVVLLGALNAPDPTYLSEYPFHPRCNLGESFAAYTSPAGSPRRGPAGSEDKNDEEGGGFLGFCGTLQTPPSPPSGGQIIGWLLPWLLIAGLRFRPRAFNLKA